jgi:copper chaperone CopZ
VDLNSATADVEYDSSRVNPEALAGAIRQLGYEVGA